MMMATILDEPAPIIKIDLDQPLSQRLQAVLAAEKPAAQKLFTEARKGFARVPQFLMDGFGFLYVRHEGPFQEELKAWANELGVSFGEVALVNCGYELDHLQHKWDCITLIRGLFGMCTAGIREVPGLGMVHLRNLDWPIESMGLATRIFHYQKKNHEFVSIGFPAFIGALSGMVPGEYSVTINWAPPPAPPNFRQYGPSFYLRMALEECRTYEQVVDRLSNVPLATSVFFTVCGARPGQGCVIERTANEHVVRPLENEIEAQSNHYISRQFSPLNDELQVYVTEKDPLVFNHSSQRRRDQMLGNLNASTGAIIDLRDLLDLLSAAPVNNHETVQRMVFCPAKGTLALDRLGARTESTETWHRSVWPT